MVVTDAEPDRLAPLAPPAQTFTSGQARRQSSVIPPLTLHPCRRQKDLSFSYDLSLLYRSWDQRG
jgi:hypothetical protein